MPTAKPKRKARAKNTCDCLSCRLQTAIIGTMAPDDSDEDFQLNAHIALAGMMPTLAMFLAAINYLDAEEWFREILSERSRLMLNDGVDFGENYKGRA